MQQEHCVCVWRGGGGGNDHAWHLRRCGADARCSAPQGYARLPAYDDAAVMEALFSRGPLSICFDASRPSFAFYSSGVFQDTEVRWVQGGWVAK